MVRIHLIQQNKHFSPSQKNIPSPTQSKGLIQPSQKNKPSPTTKQIENLIQRLQKNIPSPTTKKQNVTLPSQRKKPTRSRHIDHTEGSVSATPTSLAPFYKFDGASSAAKPTRSLTAWPSNLESINKQPAPPSERSSPLFAAMMVDAVEAGVVTLLK